MSMSASRVLTGLLIILSFSAILATVVGLIQQSPMSMVIPSLVGTIVVFGLLTAHLRGWRWSAESTVVLVTLIIVASVPPDAQQHDVYLFEALVPAILATVLLPWYWSAASFIVTLLGVLAQTSAAGLPLQPGYFVVLLIMAIGCSLAALVARSSQRLANQQTERAEASLAEAEQQRAVLAQQKVELQTQNQQQQQLLDLVSTLEVPVVRLADGVLLAPIVGTIDSRRAAELASRLLKAVREHHAQLLIFDISGVGSVDTLIIRALVDMTRAVRLLGCDVSMSGISAAVAITMTHLDIHLDGIMTARSPQEALDIYVQRKANRSIVSGGERFYGTN